MQWFRSLPASRVLGGLPTLCVLVICVRIERPGCLTAEVLGPSWKFWTELYISSFVGGGRGLTQGSPRAILGQLEESLWPDEAGRKQPRRSTAARVDPKADLGQPRGTPTATLQSVPGLFLVMPWQRSRSLTESCGKHRAS